MGFDNSAIPKCIFALFHKEGSPIFVSLKKVTRHVKIFLQKIIRNNLHAIHKEKKKAPCDKSESLTRILFIRRKDLWFKCKQWRKRWLIAKAFFAITFCSEMYFLAILHLRVLQVLFSATSISGYGNAE